MALRKATKEEVDHLSRRPLGLFTQTRIGAMPRVRRVRIGEEDGRDVYLFSVTAPVSRSGSHTNATFDHFIAAAVQLPRRIEGRVGILRRGLLRSPRTPGLAEVKEGLDARVLDDFHVSASDPEVAARWSTAPSPTGSSTTGTARTTRSSTTSRWRTRDATSC